MMPIGALNSGLGGVGLERLERPWLGDPQVALAAAAAVLVWQAVGFYMVLFIAGIQSIPSTYYEAATLDGAGGWTSFRHISLPLLWEHVQVALVYIGFIALDLFAIVQVMTEGGPNRSTKDTTCKGWTASARMGIKASCRACVARRDAPTPDPSPFREEVGGWGRRD